MPSTYQGRWRRAATALAASASAAVALAAAGDDPDFERDVLPILEARCLKCHSGEKAKSGFRLDARKAALRGGNSGERAIVPGEPQRSRLIRLVRGEDEHAVMPPTGRRLEDAQVELLERWIAGGASWPDALSGDELVKEHWSFAPPARPTLPAVARGWWPRNEIDFFTLARMESQGLEPELEADRHRLIRRLSLDLTGLPPAPAEVEEFVQDVDPGAYERLVRRLLASPRYGEHQARMWLDLARYADSAGYGSDPLRPYLWRWRDWVIDAFNANLPWDRFTIEQLAGDLLPDATTEQVLATAFHRNTMTNTEGGTSDEEFRVAAVMDRIDSTMQVWMGLTFGCAKCHSHKFDPIPQRDYYRLFAVFNQTEDSDRADEEPRIATPTREQEARRAGLLASLAEIETLRDAAAADLGAAQARWERERAAAERRWEVLKPLRAQSESGAELSIHADGSVSVQGPSPATDRTILEIPTDLDGITAFRLEALADPALPGGGPGRSAGNGNFVVNDLRVRVEPRDASPPRARWLRIENPGSQRILSLAEVQLFGAGGAGNLAPGGRATQSSTDYDGPAELAIDGGTSGHYFDAKSTTHTRTQDDPWWELDLGGERELERVVIWNRTDGNLQFRLAGMRVTLLGERSGGERAVAWQGVFPDAPDPSLEIDLAGGSLASFARASADFEQQGFFASEAIDGSVAADSGWAIGPQQGRDHVAVFETGAPLRTRGAALLRIEIAQLWGAQHTLGRFRLSAFAGPEPPHVLQGPIAAALAKPAAARSPDEARIVADHHRGIAPELARFNEARRPIEAELAQLEQEIVRTPILRELPADRRRRSFVLHKSNWLLPEDEVEPGVPSAFHPLPDGAAADRLAVARWLVAPENPLAARVAVNRFWARLFGRGLVETEEDFGSQGLPPTHPELLDWLAVRFVESGWDVKELLFTIVTSATYRQDSRVDPAKLAKDPRNVWLSRFPRARLAAETVRDQALALAGLLSGEMHGPSVYPPQPENLWQAAFNGERTYPTSGGESRWRRGLYSFWRRTVPPPSMQAFDAPSREFCAIRRQSTNTPLQAFVTLNDPCFVECAQALARRIVAQGGATRDERVAFALSLALARPARRDETGILAALFEREHARFRADPASARKLAEDPLGPLPSGSDPVELAAWTTVANVVLNLDGVLTRG